MTTQRQSILVVDDEVSLVELCRIVLGQAGYDVRSAYNGRQALRKVREEMPDLVLLDVMMPGLSGIEVCRQLREESAERPRVVMYTADGGQQTRDESLAAGANAVLTKELPVVELPEKLRPYFARI